MSETQTAARSIVDNDASLDWMRQIQTQQRTNESGNGVLRNVFKRAKSAGEDVDAMRGVISLLRRMSPEEIIARLANQIRYLMLRRVEITPEQIFGNGDLHITDKSRHQDDIWDAQEKGYRAGRLGVEVESCPYHPGTEFNAEWMRWYRQGQEAIANEMGPDAQRASAARERPARGAAAQPRLAGTENQDRPRQAAAPRKKKATSRKKASARSGGRGRKRGNASENSATAL